MGYDRVHFYDGPLSSRDKSTNLVFADKASANVVYGRDFTRFLRVLGFKVNYAYEEELTAKEAKSYIRYGAEPIPFPEKIPPRDSIARRVGSLAVQVEPPIDPEKMKYIISYLNEYCEPSDAGPIYLDHRQDYNGASIRHDGTTVTPINPR